MSNQSIRQLRLNRFNSELDQFYALMDRIESTSSRLYGKHVIADQMNEVCDDYRNRCEKLAVDRKVDVPIFASLGLKGQGKSWCIRAMILDSNVSKMVPTGVLSSEATTKLYWIGSNAPSEIDERYEVFLKIDSSLMLPLPFQYILLDTPGATDADSAAAMITKSAVSMAPIALLVTRHDQMRSAAVTTLAHRAEGAIIIPVITAVGRDQMLNPITALTPIDQSISASQSLQRQVEQWTQMLALAAPTSKWLSPVFVEDFEESGDENLAAARFRNQLQLRLENINATAIQQSQALQLSALSSQLRHDLSQIVEHQSPQLSSAVVELKRQADRIPDQTVESIMGSPTMLQIAIRNQLRASLVSSTPAIFFPYRTVLALLSLTHGAWDRLLLALSGSLPSLFTGLSTWTRNFAQSRKLQVEIKEGLQQRIDSQVLALLNPIHEKFRHSLRSIRRSQVIDQTSDHGDNPTRIVLSGVDQLQLRSTEIFNKQIEKSKTSSFWIIFSALIGSLIFWMLFAGPIVAIYRDYLLACWQTVTTAKQSIKDFPTPPASLLFTSLMLSGFPLAFFCMLVMTWFLNSRRIAKIARKITNEHFQLVGELRAQGLLKLEIVDAELDDAEFLVGLNNTTHASPPHATS